MSFSFSDHGWDFMPFRVWVGFWTAALLIIVVAFDLSSLVRYITRFTEDSFACLIALIFIYQAFLKTFEIADTAPVQINVNTVKDSFCICALPNSTITDSDGNGTLTRTLPTILSLIKTVPLNYSEGRQNNNTDVFQQCTANGGILLGDGCESSKYVPDVFFFSLILFVGTFSLSTALVKFRNSLFFPTWVSYI